MAKKKTTDESMYDPVLLAHGQKVYSYKHIQGLRKENLERKRNGKKLYNLIPQAGFQERVITQRADIQIIGGKRGGGKALSVDSKVVTPFGIRRYGDLKIGDTISNPCTGGMEKVIAIYEHPQKDLYEVTFDDGSTCECCLDHLWKVRQTGYMHKRRMLYGGGVEDDYRIWTFGMIKEWLDKQNDGMYQGVTKKGNTKKYLVIPVAEATQFTLAGLGMIRNDLDPYVIGAIIGDGCITNSARRYCTAQFCSADIEIEEEFIKAGIDMSHYRTDSRCDGSFRVYDIRNDKLEEMLTLCKLEGHSSIDKFIPRRYKYSTIEERFALIQGLMDTDGYVDDRGHCFFNTISERLANDVRFVIQSLGGIATITKKKAGYKKDGQYVECNDVYELYIKIKNSERLFRLPRKRERCKAFNGGTSEICRRIVSYKYIGKKDARCITVDDVNSLYMTNDFIVTHNTWIGLFEALPYIFNPDVNMYGFRRLEDDIARGIWKSSKQVYKGFGTPVGSSFEWKFLDGKGATMKMEHLQDPSKVSDRFRGVEMAFILIEELTEHTRDNMNVLFDLLASNRSTSGVKPMCVCTCNPVGKSNKLRYFLDYYIDPETDVVIPERSGHVRYFYRFGDDVTEIAWGDSVEEVYNNPSAKGKIDRLCQDTGSEPKDFITSLVFIEGDFQDNEILHIADPKYMNRISARGGESTTNDIVGVWRDIDSGSGLITPEDMRAMFDNTERRDGVMRASCDVALTGDFFVIFAFDGHHVVDMEAWRGMLSDDIVPFIEHFLSKNGVRKENFTYDSNGLGLWLTSNSAFANSVQFNNKSQASDSRLWGNLKSEAAEKFVKALKAREFSIDSSLLTRKFTDDKKHTFTLEERLMEERRAIKRKDNCPRFELIQKPQMKIEIGHSPDMIEALLMVMPLMEKKKVAVRRGFENW